MVRTRLMLTTLVVFLLLSVELFAQFVPQMPQIKSLTPTAVSAGGPDFILTVDGSGFDTTADVRWDTVFLNTQFINEDRLQAIVTADLIAKPGLAMVTVVDQELETTSNTVTFTITEPVEPLVITTPRILPPGTLGVGYATLIRATGGVPPYIWAKTTPFVMLPPGLSLRQDGAVIGIPTDVGKFSFPIRVADSAATIAAKTFEVTVNGPVVITTAPTAPSLPQGTVGNSYAFTLTASEGVPPYRWEIVSGFPPGLTLDSATGVLSGTPMSAGSFDFAVLVTDSAGSIDVELFKLNNNQIPGLAPLLAVRPDRLLFSFVQGSGATTRNLYVFNDGGGSLDFQVEPPPPSEASYLSVDPVQGDVTAGNPQTVNVTVDPTGLPVGTYLTEIGNTSSTTGQSIPVEVAVAISSRQSLLRLSQTGLTFSGVEGVGGAAIRGALRFDDRSGVGQGVADGVSTGVIEVLNDGSGVMPWDTQVNTLLGGPWLSVTPRSGTTGPSNSSMVAVRVDPVGLVSGTYYPAFPI